MATRKLLLTKLLNPPPQTSTPSLKTPELVRKLNYWPSLTNICTLLRLTNRREASSSSRMTLMRSAKTF